MEAENGAIMAYPLGHDMGTEILLKAFRELRQDETGYVNKLHGQALLISLWEQRRHRGCSDKRGRCPTSRTYPNH